MPVSCASIIARVSKQLYDETNDQWAFTELMRHMNPAVGEIVQLDPKAFMLNRPFQCVPGSLQNIPGDDIAMVNVLYNTSASGVQGRGITECDLETLRRGRPNWSQSPPSSTARQYAADPNDPKRFYLIPPQPNPAGWVQLVSQGVPPDVFALQIYTNGAGDVVNQPVVHLENTVGLAAGQWADPQDVAGPIKPATKILSVAAGVSVTLDTPLLTAIPPGTQLTFGDQFPLPDLYAESAYLFILYQALQRTSKDGNQSLAQGYYVQFLRNLDQDVKNIKMIQAGQTRPVPALPVNQNG